MDERESDKAIGGSVPDVAYDNRGVDTVPTETDVQGSGGIGTVERHHQGQHEGDTGEQLVHGDVPDADVSETVSFEDDCVVIEIGEKLHRLGPMDLAFDAVMEQKIREARSNLYQEAVNKNYGERAIQTLLEALVGSYIISREACMLWAYSTEGVREQVRYCYQGDDFDEFWAKVHVSQVEAWKNWGGHKVSVQMALE